MSVEAWYGILIPFLGTALGSACVFLMKKAMGDRLQRALTGFAAGVMVAASIWSLLLLWSRRRVWGSGPLSRLQQGFGLALRFCCFWITSFPICTEIVPLLKGPKAACRETLCWCWQ